MANPNADTESGRYQANKRESKGIIHDDETTTDWTPEIPFRNVSNKIIYILISFPYPSFDCILLKSAWYKFSIFDVGITLNSK